MVSSAAICLFLFGAASATSCITAPFPQCISPLPLPVAPLPSYKVRLDNCGPQSSRLPPVSAPTFTTAPVESPSQILPYKVPEIRTVSNKCKCIKTVVKPQEVQQVIVVPVIKKFVQTLSRPVYEEISYNAEPINCPQFEGAC